MNEKVMERRDFITKTAVIFIWLLIWQAASILTGLELILASPVKVFFCMMEMLKTGAFYRSMLGSFTSIAGGFGIAFLAGSVFGAAAFVNRRVKEFLAPVVYLCKTLPVVSFIILVLIWAGSKRLSMIISAIVVFPVIYMGVLNGLARTDEKLLEMAEIFEIRGIRKWRYIYGPCFFAGLTDSCRVGLGMCWKAGVSAEVIGLPLYGIGSQMYLSKLYLLTGDLLAWSFWLLLLSIGFEKLVLWCLGGVQAKLEG